MSTPQWVTNPPRRIVVISPFRAKKDTDGRVLATQAYHEAYLERCLEYVIEQGHSPYAPHYILPNFLDDTDEEQRELGIHMGLEWGSVADEAWVFVDIGLSTGMEYEIGYYASQDIPIKTVSIIKEESQNA